MRFGTNVVFGGRLVFAESLCQLCRERSNMSDEKGRMLRRSSRGASLSRSGPGARAEEIHQLVHTLSHDLRNPLGSILGYVDLLRDTAAGSLDTEQLGFLGRIEENCREMLEELARFTAELDEKIKD